MFIRPVQKKDKSSGRVYTYYRLCESFRSGKKVSQRVILDLGKIEELSTDSQRKDLAYRVDQLYRNTTSLFSVEPAVDQLAQKFVALLRRKDAKVLLPDSCIQDKTRDFEKIDLGSLKHDDIREMGAEWLCQQAAAQLKISDLLQKKCGFDEQECKLALTQIVSRAVYPGSELKTQNWIKDNSAISLLNGIEPATISRHQLYASALKLYEHKEAIEKHLNKTTDDIFNFTDTICLYDLTNFYFEGRKVNSEMAQFGRSKEKRSDCKLIVLALVVNAEGFVKISKLYKGNTADCATMQEIIKLCGGSHPNRDKNKKQIVALDAGIATKENCKWLRDNGYEYICVSRTKLKNYTLASTDPVIITDNRDRPIDLNLVKEPDENGDRYLYVRSQHKAYKEISMDTRATQKLEQELTDLNEGLSKPGTTKKYHSILTRVGRIKERHKAVSGLYTITVHQHNQKATKVAWEHIKQQQREEGYGVYFLQTSLQGKDEKTLWKLYNTLTEIEATFRILKTDLQIRPIFHKKDQSTEAHLFLAIIAYSLVATIRYQLKLKGIHDNWQEIIRKMNTQKLVTTSMKNDKHQTIIIQQPSEPNTDAKLLYDSLNFKPKPWVTKKFVLTQKPHQTPQTSRQSNSP
jgi:transposase